MTDAEIIAGLREKSKLMYGEIYLLLTRAADRLEQLTGNVGELAKPEHEPLDRWEDR